MHLASKPWVLHGTRLAESEIANSDSPIEALAWLWPWSTVARWSEHRTTPPPLYFTSARLDHHVPTTTERVWLLDEDVDSRALQILRYVPFHFWIYKVEENDSRVDQLVFPPPSATGDNCHLLPLMESISQGIVGVISQAFVGCDNIKMLSRRLLILGHRYSNALRDEKMLFAHMVSADFGFVDRLSIMAADELALDMAMDCHKMYRRLTIVDLERSSEISDGLQEMHDTLAKNAMECWTIGAHDDLMRLAEALHTIQCHHLQAALRPWVYYNGNIQKPGRVVSDSPGLPRLSLCKTSFAQRSPDKRVEFTLAILKMIYEWHPSGSTEQPCKRPKTSEGPKTPQQAMPHMREWWKRRKELTSNTH